MYEDLEQNVWDVFNSKFKKGDKVIVVHSDCKLYFGRLVRFDMMEIAVGSKEFSWDDVVLIAHDGFPCREFNSTLSLEQFDKVENWEHVLSLYKAMDIPLIGLDEDKPFSQQARQLKLGIKNEVKKQVEEEKRRLAEKKQREKEKQKYLSRPIRHLGYGCPFEITDVSAVILNPFNGLTFNEEETLYMEAPDGAVGMLWNLEGEILEVNI